MTAPPSPPAAESEVEASAPEAGATSDESVQEMVQEEVDRALGNTLGLLNLMGVILVLLAIVGIPASAFGAFLLLRRYNSGDRHSGRNRSDWIEPSQAMHAELESTPGGSLSTNKGDSTPQLKEVVSMALAAQNLMSQTRQTIEQSMQFQSKLESQLQELCDFYLSQANELLEMGNYPDAIAAYDKVLKLKDDSDKIWYQRGMALGRVQQYEDAIASLDRALEINPERTEIWWQKAHFLTASSRYENALHCFEQVKAKDPNNYQIWRDRSVPLMKLGRYEEAETSLKRAVNLKQDDPGSFYNGARLYALQENSKLAVKNLRQAITLDPSIRETAKSEPDFVDLESNEDYNKLVFAHPTQ
jgi:tetratricopeptide (TPR) repeat protein